MSDTPVTNVKANESKEVEISLVAIFNILIENILWIVIASVVVAGAAFAYTRFFVKPKYTSYTSAYVNSSESESRVATSGEITVATKAVAQYMVFVKSNTFLDSVINKLGRTDISRKTLSGMISASDIDGTSSFKVVVTSTDPQLACDAANAIAELMPDYLKEMTNMGIVKIIDYAEVAKSPSSPNIARNTIIGFLIGMVLSAGFFIVLSFFDTKIHGEKELTDTFDIPILGSIPIINDLDRED